MSADNNPEDSRKEIPSRRDTGDASSDEELAQLHRALAAEAQATVVRRKNIPSSFVHYFLF